MTLSSNHDIVIVSIPKAQDIGGNTVTSTASCKIINKLMMIKSLFDQIIMKIGFTLSCLNNFAYVLG